jgi:hypothetical protein
MAAGEEMPWWGGGYAPAEGDEATERDDNIEEVLVTGRPRKSRVSRAGTALGPPESCPGTCFRIHHVFLISQRLWRSCQSL